MADGIATTSFTGTGLVLGTQYEFIVEARNINGYSSASNSLTILHAIAPEQPSSPTSSNTGTEIVINWTAPSDNGAEITSYTITIRQSDGVTFSEDTSNCDGNDATIISTRQCTVPLATLTTGPYSLNVGDQIYIKVVATNVKGDSVASIEGSDSLVITSPDAPLNLVEDTSQRTSSSLGLTW